MKRATIQVTIERVDVANSDSITTIIYDAERRLLKAFGDRAKVTITLATTGGPKPKEP